MWEIENNRLLRSTLVKRPQWSGQASSIEAAGRISECAKHGRKASRLKKDDATDPKLDVRLPAPRSSQIQRLQVRLQREILALLRENEGM